MPYIQKKDREDLLNLSVKELINRLNIQSPGEINFVISSLIWGIFRKNKSYTTANNLLGAIDCVSREFYRREVSEYENLKITENGDL